MLHMITSNLITKLEMKTLKEQDENTNEWRALQGMAAASDCAFVITYTVISPLSSFPS